MFKDGFVATIKINDKFVDEKSDGTCVIPFDSEYTIRLKNRNSRKAVACVYIDGKEVNTIGRFILDTNSTLDLERFVNNLDQGDRFKFVPIADGRVADKNNFENGCIEVHFQLIAPVIKPIVIDECHHHHHHYNDDCDHYPYWPYVRRWPWWDGPHYVNKTVYGEGDIYTAASENFTVSLDSNDASLMNCSSRGRGMSAGMSVEKGATIKGAISKQKFSYSYIGELEEQETIIRLQLNGTKNKQIVSHYIKMYCIKCKKKYNEKDIYCSSCGEKK